MYVDVIDEHVAQEPSIVVAVDLGGVRDQVHRGTDGRELGKTRTCLLSPALCADAVVGQFGSVDAQQADSAEIPAVSVVDAHGVAVDDRGDDDGRRFGCAPLAQSSLGGNGALPSSGGGERRAGVVMPG